MAEYIDREALKKFLHQEDFDTPDERWKPESEFAQMIDAVPAADVVEVVRCENCQHNPGYKRIKDLVWCRQFRTDVHRDGFCSYGERKGDCNNCNNHSNERKGGEADA